MKKILLMLLCVSVLGCSKNSVESEKPVDVLLIGGGIMSATLGTYLNELEPGWTIEMVERLDKVAEESSNGWNNAGTGHSAFCELNYTSEAADGSMDISKAVAINENFEISKQFWAYQVDRKVLNDPKSFINNVPHMSFVWGDDNVAFLKKRHAALQHSSLFRGMEYSEDPEQIKQGAAGDGRPRAGAEDRRHAHVDRHRRQLRRDHPPTGGLAVGQGHLQAAPAT